MNAALSTAEPRQFLTATESNYRLSRAPEVACLQFNPAAPDASLLAFALQRADAMDGVLGMMLRDLSALSQDEQHTLESLACSAQELRLVIAELQRRDGEQYQGALT